MLLAWRIPELVLPSRKQKKSIDHRHQLIFFEERFPFPLTRRGDTSLGEQGQFILLAIENGLHSIAERVLKTERERPVRSK